MMGEIIFTTFHKRVKRCIKKLLSFKKYLHKYRSDEYFNNIDWHKSIMNELGEAAVLIHDYNFLKIENLVKVRQIKIGQGLVNLTLEDVIINLENILRDLQDVDSNLSIYLRPNLSEIEKGKIDLLRKDLDNIETEEKIRKNLEIGLIEAESGHELACEIISARVIVERLDKIKGKNDEERLATLTELKIIDNAESSKFSSKAFLDASRAARNAINHQISWFPTGVESLSLLSSAFRMTEWVSKYFKKIGEEENGKKS